MPTGSDDVRFQGRTGSNQTTVKMTRLTLLGPPGMPAFPPLASSLCRTMAKKDRKRSV